MNDALPRYSFESLPSTNAKAWELIAQGNAPPFAVTARQQTAGRGQWGRVWQSDLGGLYLSMAIAFDYPSRCLPHLTLFSAWGIADSLRQAAIPVVLKWPNDLILEGRKLGGIKSEVRSVSERMSQAVIGVGINVNNAVPKTGINLREYQPEHEAFTVSAIADLVVQGINVGYQRYQTEGIEPILEEYLKLFINLGQSVVVENQSGIITGVTEQGELKVRLRSPGATTEVCLSPGSIQLGYDF